jgi:glutamate/tyrosine decarboxylase-like PLP-dependent enzyme
MKNFWHHIDAAYGGGAVLSHQVKPLFRGSERAHTIAIDPHKWLFQPFECACVLG